MKRAQNQSKRNHPNDHHGHRIITLAATIRSQKETIPSDVLGSYTGTGQKEQQPEQDADDL